VTKCALAHEERNDAVHVGIKTALIAVGLNVVLKLDVTDAFRSGKNSLNSEIPPFGNRWPSVHEDANASAVAKGKDVVGTAVDGGTLFEPRNGTGDLHMPSVPMRGVGEHGSDGIGMSETIDCCGADGCRDDECF